MVSRYEFPNAINITYIKMASLANISDMALKVQCAVECDTNVPGILSWKNHRTMNKYNRRKLESISKLGSSYQ